MKIPKSPLIPGPSDPSLRTSESFYENGGLHFRFTQKKTADGSGWFREGPFEEFYPDGKPAARGFYLDGLENGRWTLYHENGQTTAEGYYRNGEKTGAWRYFDPQGKAI